MNRIRDLRTEKGISQNELAKALGLTQQAISAYENGLREPDLETLNKIANYFNVSIDYLLGRTDIRNSDILTKAGLVEFDKSKTVPIPIIGSVRAGTNGILAYEEILGVENVEQDIIKDEAKYFFLQVKGDSMYPEIKEGDLVLVRQQSDVESGDIAVVIINGDEGIVKKVIKKDHSIVLYSINPVYEPIIITNPEELIIVGKVKRVVRVY
ncbi:SOS-response transcriptional repressors (RecA-mediated autopeptidases) [Thermoanaerobacter sp. YS13]|uniref:LexA family protein n=1 Tax=Thermoanaerobacter sp. YS13 TaxID=1511746 RepID=UPI000573F8A4|nr:LexA family transcriptional regulator [Thermoanaerobacter sp. YS13]KHO63394.1 SOS-response transcriptional repressors (RecA-mediated autopeptidases) [Thermoanaerobacter sp. YS13]